ncbi:MAG: polysaccharide deacetylase family protein, partial [Solirubrobacterales bacterium]
MAGWPGGASGALCLSFDNLGEAAEIELGALPADAPLGEHFTATRVLPPLLDALGERDLAATFFVEGLNAELYPGALEAIAVDGHEVGYHAWRHEQWDELSAAEQTENLRRGVDAFDAL